MLRDQRTSTPLQWLQASFGSVCDAVMQKTRQGTAQQTARRTAVRPRRHALPLLGFGTVTLLLFGSVLFGGETRVLGHQTTDMALQFLAWRDFGFRELRAGNLALWNPHIYAGAPYFGGFQGALLYPLNVLFLVLPVVPAVNWTIAVHVWLLGALTYSWLVVRQLHPGACWMGGVLAMLCGAHFPHIYAGHLSNLCTMVWTPLVFLALDGVCAAASRTDGGLGGPMWRCPRAWRWCLGGAFAVAMQLFAGHPQYVVFTAVAAGLYAVLRLVGSQHKVMIGVMLGGIYGGGVLLAAVQVLAGTAAAAETLRGVPLPYAFAATFGFPPENVLTLIAPDFFGAIAQQRYWGRGYWWEMSLFIGVTGVAMAVHGLRAGGLKRQWREVVLVLALLLLALGSHTPLFRMLYDWVPGFARFRGMSKFIWPAELFLVVLAAYGCDRLLRDRHADGRLVAGVGVAVGVLVAGGVGVSPVDWQALMQRVLATGEAYLPPATYAQPAFVAQAQHDAAYALFVAAGTGLVLGLLLLGMRHTPRLVVGVLALAVVELGVFAARTRATFDSTTVAPAALRTFLAHHPRTYRMLNPRNANSAMLVGASDIWGSDPGVVRRYAEFMTWSQGGTPDQATQYVPFTRLDPLYAMLRLRYALVPDEHRVRVIEALQPPMDQVHVVTRYQVVTDRDAIFSVMRSGSFDPRREVILEREPVPRPVASEHIGTAQVVASSTDWIEIAAEVASPSVLVITEVYTPAWRAVALPGSSQERYELMPANYILRAVPLAAGRHRLRVEYAPAAFTVGTWVSVIAWSGFVVGGIIAWRVLHAESQHGAR